MHFILISYSKSEIVSFMKKVPLHSIEEIYIIYNLCDRISGVLVSVLALSVVYSGFNPQSSQRL